MQGPQTRPLRPVPRWVRWTILPLLVLVPIGYLIIAAEQSRGSGQDKEASATAKSLTLDWPSRVQRRIYQVPIPHHAKNVAYLETNSWNRSVFYVQFTTTPGGLDTFLAQIGLSRSALKNGDITVGPAEQRTAGWTLAPGRTWAGLSRTQHGDKPDHDITVDLTNPDVPAVYVVSAIDF